MPPDNPLESALKIIWPSKAEVRDGLAKIEEYLPFWKTNPALLVIKPELGLIVGLQSLEHDERGFTLVCGVEQALVAPPGFETGTPINLDCVWNQPYLSMAATRITAPYGFYLHFGVEGVERARALSAIFVRRGGTKSEMLLAELKRCFSRGFAGLEESAEFLGLEPEEADNTGQDHSIGA
jgi:hypothetical protein